MTDPIPLYKNGRNNKGQQTWYGPRKRTRAHMDQHNEQRRSRTTGEREGDRASTQRWRRAVREERRTFLSGLKNGPCLDCGGRFPPECMDFDHVRGEKKFIISQGMGRSRQSILSEAAKCDLVCSNCHRIRTAKRRNWRV